MNGSTTRSSIGWGARLLVGFVLILLGAAAAVWALAHYQRAARFVGVAPPPAAPVTLTPKAVVTQQPPAVEPEPPATEAARIQSLEQRLSAVENATQRAEGSAGRADALVIVFAARRAIDRGLALGYLENLLTQRFGGQYQAAVGTVIAASRQPVRLDDLVAQYQALGSDLRRGGPQDSWWTNFKREMGSLIEVHRADQPPASVDARYSRALQRLEGGDVDQALAETMRLPGAARAGTWIGSARRYIAAHRALDQLESGALLPAPAGAATH